MASKMLNFLLYCLILSIDNSAAVQKEWIHTTLYTDVGNWKPPQLPCPNGRTLLKDGIVFVSNGTFPAEIVLSPNTEIVFDANSEILLGPPARIQKSEPACEPSEFSPSKRTWHNPFNWKNTDGFNTPFIEKVPCLQDDVIFPKHNAFSTTITKPVQAKSVTLKGKKITDDATLQSYLSSEEEKRKFEYGNQATLTISQEQCPKQGCVCEVYKDQKMRDLVCNSFECPLVTCQNKVKTKQDCCYSCGGLLEYEYSTDFDLSACRASLKTKYSSTAYVSRISDESIQIFLTDTNTNPVTDNMLDSLIQFIQKSGHPCSAKAGSISKKTSTDFVTNNKETDEKTIVLAVLIPIVAVIVFVILIVFYVRYRRNRAFDKHEEFKNPEDIMDYPGIDIIDAQTTDFIDPYNPDEEASIQKPGGTQAFSNPAYDLNEENEIQPEDNVDFKKSVIEVDINAPSYNAGQASLPIDQTNPHYETVEVSSDPVHQPPPAGAHGIENKFYEEIIKEVEANENENQAKE